ncbi:DUF421 domain-containing protein [Alicyclobacillaceae bacterium I2511]|nr:DUF421 domain-containing protein [Alicyclobacillaceae bacterium I2511]
MVVMLALRVMGKREIGKLSIFDFVVSIMIAELSTVPMEDTHTPLYMALVSIALLVVLQVGVALVQLKSQRFRKWVEGEPVVLVEHGRVRDGQLRRTRYTMEDLLMQLREQGLARVQDVEFAVLETSGKLSVLPKAEKRPLQAADLNQMVTPEALPMSLIMDGQPVVQTLARLRRDMNWLNQVLSEQGYSDWRDVFYASIDGDGRIHVDPMESSAHGLQSKHEERL